MESVNIEEGLNKPNSEHTQKVLLQVQTLSHLTNIIVGIQKWCKSLHLSYAALIAGAFRENCTL